MAIKLLNTLIMIAVALSIMGVINRTRAMLAGRKGIRFFQHVMNVRLQLRKGSVYSTTTTLLFRIAPCVYLGAALIAFCLSLWLTLSLSARSTAILSL